jgi:hypothetical protein
MMAAVTYLSLGVLVSRVQPRIRLKVFTVGAAQILAHRGQLGPGNCDPPARADDVS